MLTGTSAAPQNKLRMDARLMQILHGVKAGTIAVEDAALEIIEGRGLDRRSFMMANEPSIPQLKTESPAIDRVREDQCLFGMSIIESKFVTQPMLITTDYGQAIVRPKA